MQPCSFGNGNKSISHTVNTHHTGTGISLYETWKNEAQRHLTINSGKTLELDLLQNKKFIDFMDRSPMVILVINHQHSTYDYCSKNIKSLLGYTAEEMLRGGVAFGTALVAEEHKEVFHEAVTPAMFDNMETYRKSGDLKRIRLSYNFKIQRKDLRTIWLLQHMSVIETDENGAALWSMVFMSDLTGIKKDEAIDFTVSKLDDSGYFEPVFSTTFPSYQDKVHFTQREDDIIKRISAGHSTQQIAEQLFISTHTVGTHRKNILKKLKAMPHTDLASTLKMKGLWEF